MSDWMNPRYVDPMKEHREREWDDHIERTRNMNEADLQREIERRLRLDLPTEDQ